MIRLGIVIMKQRIRALAKTIVKSIPGAWNLRLIMNAYRAPISVILHSKRRIKEYRNHYQGKRCFIVGNGPSLKPEDLDKIKDEYSFAANRIYKIFSQTKWRPSFYCIQDENALYEMESESMDITINNSIATFIRMHGYRIIKNRRRILNSICFIPIFPGKKPHGNFSFSTDASKWLYDGETVTYMAIQLAVYMGFTQIYLVGVDHCFPYVWTEEGKVKVNDLSVASHFYDGAENNFGKNAHIRRGTYTHLTTMAYQAAEAASQKIDVRIYNATRGGKLEVFERVDYDGLFD